MQHAVHIMGILNVTPDSFSDGGACSSQAALINRIDTLLAEGADSASMLAASRPVLLPYR
jgi:dihydropteroate synthase